MRVLLPGVVALAVMITLPCSVVSGDELAELREKAVAMKKEAAQLRENGNVEEAEKLDRHAMELMAEVKRQFGAQKPEGEKKKEAVRNHPEIQRLKERLHDLHAAMKKAEASGASEDERHELREQIGRTERELAAIAAGHAEGNREADIPPQFREQAEKLEMAGRRIHHLRVAAENLMAAEMPDAAHELMTKAEAMEKDVHAAREQLAAQIRESQKNPEAELHERERREAEHGGEVRELREQNERLRNELQELRELVERLREERGEDFRRSPE